MAKAYKKAELSQRWPRDAPYIWCDENFRESLTMPTTTFPEIFNGLLLRSILWMCVQNLNFVALPVFEIIGVLKIWAVPGYAHTPSSPKFLMGFCSNGPVNVAQSCLIHHWSTFKSPKQMTKEFSFIVYPRTRPASVGPVMLRHLYTALQQPPAVSLLGSPLLAVT